VAIVIQAVLAAVVSGKRVVRAVATDAVPAALAVSAVGVPAQVVESDNPNVCVRDPNESPVTTNVDVVVFNISCRFESIVVPSWKRTGAAVVPAAVTVADPITAKRGVAPVKVANAAATLATLPVVAPAMVDDTPLVKSIRFAPLAAVLVANAVPLLFASVDVSNIFRVTATPEAVSIAAYCDATIVVSAPALIAAEAVNWKTTDEAPTVPPVTTVPAMPEIVALGTAPNTPFVRS
jgi:hypothetical protein